MNKKNTISTQDLIIKEKMESQSETTQTVSALKLPGNPQYTLQDQGIFYSRCSRHMTGNKSFLTDYQEVDGGFVAFAGSPKRGLNLIFSLSPICVTIDKKNSVLFTETECLVLSPDFKLLDESQVLLKVPRQNNMYGFDLKNVVPSGVSPIYSIAGQNFTTTNDLFTDPLIPDLEDTGIFSGAYDDEDVGLLVYQNGCESALLLYDTIEEDEMSANSWCEDPQFPVKWSKVNDPSSIEGSSLLLRLRVKKASTPIKTNKALLKDEEAKDVDVQLYRSMIRSLMYLIASRPDIMFAVCAYVRVLQSTINYGLWYPRDSPFDWKLSLIVIMTGASLDRKSTTGGCQFLGKRLISWQCKKQTIVANSTTEAEYVAASYCCMQGRFSATCPKVSTARAKVSTAEPNPTIYASYIEQFWATTKSKTVNDVKQIHATVNGKTVVISESSVKSDLHFNDEDGITCLLNDEIFVNLALIGEDDRVVRAATTASSLEAEQEIKGNTSGSGEDIMEHQVDLTDFVPPTPHDSPLSGGHTPGSDEDLVIIKMQKNVKRLEKALRARTLGMKLFKIGTSKRKGLDKENVSKQGRKSNKTKPIFNDSDFDVLNDAMENVEGGSTAEQITTTGDTLNTASINVSTAGPSNVGAAGPSISTVGDIFEDEMTTIADTLVAIRSARPRTTSVMIRNVEEEPMRATLMDEELAQRLFEEEQAQFEKEQRIAREKAAEQEAKDTALIEQMEDVQARMDADELLAERLQQEEREQFTIDEQARMLVDLITERKKFFVAQRAEQIRNKPPTRAQLRNKMVTYLKHMGNYTHTQLKSKSFEEIQKLYEKEQKWINDFVSLDSKMVKDSGKKDGDSQKQTESSKKRPKAEHDKESVKKQKLEDEAEREELRACLDIVSGDDIAMDFESLATKYLIIDWKTHILTDNMMYYQIIRADESSKNYKIFSGMLDDFDRQDMIDLYRLVKERYETTSPEGHDLLLWGDLKNLFEPSKEDEIWKNQQDYNLIRWRLFDSCGVHVLLMDTGIAIHMMVENTYPLTQEMLSRMLNIRLEVDHESYEGIKAKVKKMITNDKNGKTRSRVESVKAVSRPSKLNHQLHQDPKDWFTNYDMVSENSLANWRFMVKLCIRKMPI
ncbi:hypothetical protein Tco_1135041 [Tanacetum coccineum]